MLLQSTLYKHDINSIPSCFKIYLDLNQTNLKGEKQKIRRPMRCSMSRPTAGAAHSTHARARSPSTCADVPVGLCFLFLFTFCHLSTMPKDSGHLSTSLYKLKSRMSNIQGETIIKRLLRQMIECFKRSAKISKIGQEKVLFLQRSKQVV